MAGKIEIANVTLDDGLSYGPIQMSIDDFVKVLLAAAPALEFQTLLMDKEIKLLTN